MPRYRQGARSKWWWWRQGRWRSKHIGVVLMWQRLQGSREAVVSSWGWGEVGSCYCGCTRWRWMVCKVQGGSRMFVRLGARSAAPAVRQKNRDRNQTFRSSIPVTHHPPTSLQLHLLHYSSPSSKFKNVIQKYLFTKVFIYYKQYTDWEDRSSPIPFRSSTPPRKNDKQCRALDLYTISRCYTAPWL